MDWDDLRIFLAVARADSLSGAGKRLNIDASTVGRRIARLEGTLGAKLFVKTPQGYALAPEGERLLPHAESAELALSGAKEALSGPDNLTGQFRIGAPDGCANYLLPQICARLCETHPGLEIQIIALPRVFNLSRREADMAIAVSQPQAGRLVVQRLTDYQLHLAAHEDYLRSRPPILARDDLRGHRMIGYIPDMIFDRELDYLTETGAEWAQLTSNSVSVQMQAIRAGAGLGIVHDFAIPFCPGVRRILTGQISLTRSFWLIRHADDRRSQRMNRLADALGQGIRSEVARLQGLLTSEGSTQERT
ncbi:LysR family transcriptional regulator [Paracoccus aestuariivivens]|uniref:LysR family transcriptional regulator n=1 Tax=Paracoccus aestuariivivens TaxID=1820333 RepID=A0A6L6JBD5_9RHOB|nr:LysR family transcriptional regulator [Paracoccus aestuariivivens]MTH77301.1 LysR family transcriptional regulator [Paracoccus aestuariivivens]